MKNALLGLDISVSLSSSPTNNPRARRHHQLNILAHFGRKGLRLFRPAHARLMKAGKAPGAVTWDVAALVSFTPNVVATMPFLSVSAMFKSILLPSSALAISDNSPSDMPSSSILPRSVNCNVCNRFVRLVVISFTAEAAPYWCF